MTCSAPCRVLIHAAVACLFLCICGSGSAQEVPSPVEEQNWTAEIDVRNRFVQDVGGSRDVYRSIVNLGEGPRLFDGQIRFRDTGNRYMDYLDANGNAWGGDPYNTARVEFGLRDAYDFRFDYRNVTYFNSLPSFANPLLSEGLLVSQRSLDLTRRQADAELRIKPNSLVSPFVAFSHASGFGNGITTFVTDGNEFPVSTDLDDRLNSVRGGVRLNFSRINFTLEQGRTSFEDDQDVFFSDGVNRGNRRTTFLGQDILLDELNQNYAAEGDGIFNRAVVQGRPWEVLNFTGQFLYSRPAIDVEYQHTATGNFTLLRAITPFTGQFEQSSGDAKWPRPSGSWSTEVRPHQRVRVVQSWYTDRFHVSAGSFTAQTFNTTPETTNELRSFDLLVLNYNQHQVDVIYDATRAFTLRGGHRYVWGDAVAREPSLRLVGRPDQAEVRRHVGLAGAAVRLRSKLSVTFDFEASPGDKTFFRTGLMDYHKGKVRARYRLRPSLTLSGGFSVLNNENPAPDIDFDLNSRQTSVSLFWTPQQGQRFTILADYTRATLRTDIPIVSLPFLQRVSASYRDRGHHGSVFAKVYIDPDVVLSLGGSLSVVNGSRPTRYYQPQVRFSGPIHGKVSWVAEWRWFGFEEQVFRDENFRTHIFSTGLRFSL